MSCGAFRRILLDPIRNTPQDLRHVTLYVAILKSQEMQSQALQIQRSSQKRFGSPLLNAGEGFGGEGEGAITHQEPSGQGETNVLSLISLVLENSVIRMR